MFLLRVAFAEMINYYNYMLLYNMYIVIYIFIRIINLSCVVVLACNYNKFVLPNKYLR